MSNPIKMTNKAREAARSLAIRYAHYHAAATELREARTHAALRSDNSVLASDIKLAKSLAEWSDLLIDAQEATGVVMVEPLTLLIHRKAARDAVENARTKKGN